MLKENNIDNDYLIDNTNSNLSGGQISKIAIAQALNKKSDIIIFDETTSNLDEKTEKIILENIKNNYKDKTIILISHRKSNVNLFNKILNFNNGRLIK
jgi:ABC-type bacteriocin/lantibiotic exporter with double-glycine peptidase domain